MITKLHKKVLRELIKHKIGSARWMFWRGVAVGLEHEGAPALVTMKWLRALAKEAKCDFNLRNHNV